MIDYRIINVIGGVIGLLVLLVYWRSGKHKELRPAAVAIGGFISFYVSVYSIAIIHNLETATISMWLRPPFSGFEIAATIPFLVLAIKDDVVVYFRKRGWIK